uniref:RNA polymerase sigma factor n=1 Tax=Sphingomonas bacterium TaxID=1895847 RepID=UPI0026306F81|nr:RNA polymerase sigma factor [Sphingomonas bacterium]
MSAFEKGVEALLPRLRRFAHGLAANRADADDLTQITIERALRARLQWQEGTRLDAWLYRIMRNCWIDTVRARGRASRVMAPEEAGEHVGHDPTAPMDAKIDLERLMQAMEKLPPEQREVIALVLIEGFGYRETAELLDLPIGTISSRLVRGRTALLALVKEG